MLLNRSSRRFGTWLAMLAMALNVLWPLLAHAKPQGDSPVIEICTSAGMKWAAADGSGQQPAKKNLSPHCEFCSLSADRAPLPSAAAIAPVEVSIAIAAVAAGESAPVVARPCFSPALPRAPPVLS